MNVFGFVSFVIAAAVVYRIATLYINRKHAAERSSNEQYTEVLERCRQLEERVRVLERIVTDKQVDLEREFDEL